jgi:hypothetical protein
VCTHLISTGDRDLFTELLRSIFGHYVAIARRKPEGSIRERRDHGNISNESTNSLNCINRIIDRNLRDKLTLNPIYDI